MPVALERALDLYDGIWADWMELMEGRGIRFEEFGDSSIRCEALRAQLMERGASFCNAGASIALGDRSDACVACTGDCLSRTFYITLSCHRKCYFCFNPNQEDYEKYLEEDYPWATDLQELIDSKMDVACIGLTGGEPLLRLDQTLDFLTRCRAAFPQAHLRLYSTGDLLTEEMCRQLADAGLDEFRFSVKLDDTKAAQERAYANMALAKPFIPEVMVEMPVIPGTFDEMANLLRRLDEIGIFGINLLEFCYPMHNWDEFEKRGFEIKNPPYPVLYDYGYAGSLPIAGSEEDCLRLMLLALDEGLSINVHYCSLENKHRSEIRQRNTVSPRRFPHHAMDPEDFFLKTVTVYGPDRVIAKNVLESVGCTSCVEDEAEGTLSFHPQWLSALAGTGLAMAYSYNVVEERDGQLLLREVEVEPLGM